ncbi:MAG: serine/threonine-protein kinase [Gemmatimonas sp.]
MIRLDDRFDIVREIGQGGMGRVVLAHDNHLNRRVALKLLPSELSESIGVERFAREIRVTARLVHPGIVPLFDSGRTDDGQLFYVMPYVDGPTLRSRIGEAGKLSLNESVALACDLAEALSYAHAQEVIHRDIKPENIFCYGGRAMLADFGIAKVTGNSADAISTLSHATSAGEIIGTLSYISPEQGTGDAIDARSDLYSLGCVLFEMLSGEPPYVARQPIAVLAQHVSAPVPELSRRNADVPENMCRLVASLLAKNPSDRPSSAADLLAQLRDITKPDRPSKTVSAPQSSQSKYTPESMAAYNEGRSYWMRGMQGGPGAKEKVEIAIMYFNKSRALDSRNALAVVGLSDAAQVMGYRGFRDHGEAHAEARALRLEALAMEGDLAEVHNSIGVVMLYFEDDFEGAGRELLRSVELGPDVSTIRRFWGVWLKIAGRLDEALKELHIAAELAPDAASSFNALGDGLIAMGSYEEAIPYLRRALRLNPSLEIALERLEVACHRGGRFAEALDARRAWLGQRRLTDRLTALDENFQKLGWHAARELDVRRELTSFLERATLEGPFEENGTSRTLADQIITCYADLGEWKSAMDWVERSYHARPGRLRRVLTDFLFDRRGLAVDPRYAPLLRTAGLQDLLGEYLSNG